MLMSFIISSKGTELTPPIRSYAQKKSLRFNKYENNILKIEVVLTLSDLREGKLKNCTADITLTIPKTTLKVTETADEMYKAIDVAVDRMEEELRRHKERFDSRQKRGLSYAPRKLAKLLTGWIKK